MPKITDINIPGGLKEVYIGNKPIKKVYVGNDLVWYKPEQLIVVPSGDAELQRNMLHQIVNQRSPQDSDRAFVKINSGDILSQYIGDLLDVSPEPPSMGEILHTDIQIERIKEIELGQREDPPNDYKIHGPAYEWRLKKYYKPGASVPHPLSLLKIEIELVWGGNIILTTEIPRGEDIKSMLGPDSKKYFRDDPISNQITTINGSLVWTYRYEIYRNTSSFSPSTVECGFVTRKVDESIHIKFWWKPSQSPTINIGMDGDSFGEYLEKTIATVNNATEVPVKVKLNNGFSPGPVTLNSTNDWLYQSITHKNLTDPKVITSKVNGRTYFSLSTNTNNLKRKVDDVYTFEIYNSSSELIGNFDVDLTVNVETTGYEEPPETTNPNYYIDIGLGGGKNKSKINMSDSGIFGIYFTPKYDDGTIIPQNSPWYNKTHRLEVGSDQDFYKRPNPNINNISIDLDDDSSQSDLILNTTRLKTEKSDIVQNIRIYDVYDNLRGSYNYTLISSLQDLDYIIDLPQTKVLDESSGQTNIELELDFESGSSRGHPDFDPIHKISFSDEDIWNFSAGLTNTTVDVADTNDDDRSARFTVTLVSNFSEILKSKYGNQDSWTTDINIKDSRGVTRGSMTCRIDSNISVEPEYTIKILGIPNRFASTTNPFRVWIRAYVGNNLVQGAEFEEYNINPLHIVEFDGVFRDDETDYGTDHYTSPTRTEFRVDLKNQGGGHTFYLDVNESNFPGYDVPQRIKVFDANGKHKALKVFVIHADEPPLDYSIILSGISNIKHDRSENISLSPVSPPTNILNHSKYSDKHTYRVTPNVLDCKTNCEVSLDEEFIMHPVNTTFSLKSNIVDILEDAYGSGDWIITIDILDSSGVVRGTHVIQVSKPPVRSGPGLPDPRNPNPIFNPF